MSLQLGLRFAISDDAKAPESKGVRPPARPVKRSDGGGTAQKSAAPRQLTLTMEPARAERSAEVTVRGQVRVEEALRSVIGPRVIVRLTANRSTMISFNRRNGVLYVRAHAIFADAPDETLVAVARFVSEGKAAARDGKLIDAFIEQHRHQIRRPLDRDVVVQPYGEVHDLKAGLDRLNRQFFDGAIRAAITWSKAARNQRRTSIRMGSYCEEQRLIRIHPALDQAFVPVYFVESVIFHEMLHELHGIEELESGRRCIHSSEFLEEERRFPEYEDARRWERKHLHKLLRY